MQKKYHFGSVIGAVVVTVILMSGFNAVAYKGMGTAGEEFNTDKTDRTLIKEIHANQSQQLALLKEIKGILQAGK